jgi:hypothetical protein
VRKKVADHALPHLPVAVEAVEPQEHLGLLREAEHGQGATEAREI